MRSLLPNLALLMIWAAAVSAHILNVPSLYSTIQSALDSSAMGDTLLVAPGTYHELLVTPPHEVTLASHYLFTNDTLDIVGTVLDGQLQGTVITVTPCEPYFHLNGFTVTGGWGRQGPSRTGGGLWILPEANLDLRNVVLTGNGTEFNDGIGAAAMGGMNSILPTSLILHNVYITNNNHLPQSNPNTTSPAFYFLCTERIQISNLVCNGVGLNDAAISASSRDSLYADSVTITGYQANGGTIAGFGGRYLVDIRDVRVVNNSSCGTRLLSLASAGIQDESGLLRVRDVLITQNSDTCDNPSSWEQLSFFSDYLDAENISITNNRIATNYVLDVFAEQSGMIRNLKVENNTTGSEVVHMDHVTGSIASFTNISLDSSRFCGNTAHLPSGQTHDYAGCPLVFGSYYWTENYEVDSLTWRKVSFRDNWVYDHINPAVNHNGLRGRAILLEGFAHGNMLFEDCEWVNNRVNIIAPEVDLFPGPRNVGSTVELVGRYGEVGTNVTFNNCLFQDNDDGGLYAENVGNGIMQSCRFLRNNRFAAVFYSNNENGFVTVRNCWFHGTNMQQFYLPYPQYQGVLTAFGRAGALIENLTVSSCSTSFSFAFGGDYCDAMDIKNVIESNNWYNTFIRPHENPQESRFSFCLSESLLEGVGNVVANAGFDPDFGPPYLNLLSPAIDAGDPNPALNDLEDPLNPSFALWPSRGTLRNDIGITGGPFAMAPDTGWATLVPRWEPRIQPQAFTLGAPWPNPFNPVTHIPYTLLQPCRVTISVYNLLGQRVALLMNDLKPAGTHTATFDAARMASGIYLITLEAAVTQETRTVTLLR